MRYFLISYRTERHIGTVWFAQPYFPSVREIGERIKEPFTLLAILNIFEFKSKEDFEDFCEKSVEEMIKEEEN